MEKIGGVPGKGGAGKPRAAEGPSQEGRSDQMPPRGQESGFQKSGSGAPEA